MKPLLLAAGAVALTSPLTLAAPAEAQNRNYNQQLRDCNRDLRRADSRAEYRRELRQCQRDLQRAQRQDARDWRRYSAYDYNRFEPGQRQYYADRYYRDGRYYSQRRLSYKLPERASCWKPADVPVLSVNLTTLLCCGTPKSNF